MEAAVRDHTETARLAAEREKTLRAVARIEEAASAAVGRAQQSLAQARQASAEGKRAFGASMAETYSDPDRAAQGFLRDADARGTDRAAQRMAVDPEQYGPLRALPTTSRYSLVRGTTTEPARTNAPPAAEHGRAFVEARQDVLKAEAQVRRAGEVHRTVSSELSGLDEIARGARTDEFGPAAVRARLERLDKALRERSARASGVRLTPTRMDGPAGKALAERVGSVGMVTANKAVGAASRALGRDD